MNILPLQSMSYKAQKKENELLTKLKIVKYYKKTELFMKDIAEKFHCHRNTVSNIINDFDSKIKQEDRNKLLNKRLDKETIEELMKPIASKNTRPRSRHPRQATIKQEKKVVQIFNSYLRVGPKRMKRHLDRKYSKPGNKHKRVSELEKSLSKLTLAQIKGIYKRNKLKLKKKRSSNGEVVHLYDYRKIAAFEYLHIDTKHILDKHSLPSEIYERFDKNDEIPKYEWNIIDAKSRFRFIAYSYNLTSEFGFKFLLSTIQFIRAVTNNKQQHITVFADNGQEFCGGSKRKEKEWNNILKLTNSHLESYHEGHDVRKNLIERSHKTDDSDFYVSRGFYIHDRDSFLKEARDYTYYFNAIRLHSGINMKGRTPTEVLKDNKVFQATKLLNFPTMILEENINMLRDVVSPVELKEFLVRNEIPKVDQKELVDLKSRFKFLVKNAQNVLTPYLLDLI